MAELGFIVGGVGRVLVGRESAVTVRWRGWERCGRRRGACRASVELVGEVKAVPLMAERVVKRSVTKKQELWSAVQRERPRIVVAIVALLVASAASMIMPLAFGRVVRTVTTVTGVTPGPEAEALWNAIAAVAVLYVVEPLATIVWVRSACRITEQLVFHAKMRVFKSILHQDIAFFDRHSSGELTSAVAKDIGEIRSLVWSNLGRDRGLRALLETIGAMIVLCIVQPKLALAFAVTIPTAACIVTGLGRKLGRVAMEESSAFGFISGKISEIFRGVRTVRSFGGEQYEVDKVSEMMNEAGQLSMQMGRLQSTVEASNRFAIYLTLLVLSAAGGYLVMAGELAPTMFLSSIGYVYSLTYAVQGITYTFSDANRAFGSIRRISRVLASANATTPRTKGAEGIYIPGAVAGKIEFRDVWFSYQVRPDVPVLKGLNLTLKPYHVTALVGPSGSGKSTIVSLLSRFYSPDKGTISLDGTDVGELERQWYVSQVSLVGQNPTLFSGTIRENIAYGARNCEASDNAVIRAARLANADEFIRLLPDGYDTHLGEGGELSGGQKQRIAIARAILKDAPILILDEATSALDTESERLVQDALDMLMKSRTCLVIAHRLSTVLSADKICVVYDGQVMEQGTHGQLMKQDETSVYRRLMKSQTGQFLRQSIEAS